MLCQGVHLLICHLVLEGLQLALMLAPQLSLLQAELMPQLLLLIPLALHDHLAPLTPLPHPGTITTMFKRQANAGAVWGPSLQRPVAAVLPTGMHAETHTVKVARLHFCQHACMQKPYSQSHQAAFSAHTHACRTHAIKVARLSFGAQWAEWGDCSRVRPLLHLVSGTM